MDRLTTIRKTASRLRAGDLHPRDLVGHCLHRMRQFEPRVQAWVHVDEQGALDEAERLGALLQHGEDLGPLHGIPVGIKDIIDVRGMPTEAGSPLFKGAIAQQDAALVSRLRAAGAIILGKTVTTEFACFDPSPTRNPWNLEHTPGGSSSGSAAAVATEMCFAAIGSQTGGSITRPAAYCGVAGLKPTFGRVDMSGVIPVSEHLDHVGPMARSATDLWQMLGGISETDSSNSTLEAPQSPPLHIIDEYFTEHTDPAVLDVTAAACQKLQDAGASMPLLGLPRSFHQSHMMHRGLMAVDLAEMHFQSFTEQPDSYGPQIRSLIEEGMAFFAVDYALALRHQPRFRQDIQAIIRDDVVAVTPATPTAAPRGLESTGDPGFNSPWSYAGVPTVTIPCGLTGDGLPCGLQLIGSIDREHHLLSVAAWCEAVLGFDHQPPLLDA